MNLFVQLVILSLTWISIHGIKSHQFIFSGGNIAYGNVPAAIHINGHWYLQQKNQQFKSLLDKGYTEEELRGQLYVCTTKIDRKMTLLNEAAELKKVKMIKTLLESKQDSSVITPYIDIADCHILRVNPSFIESSSKNRMVQRFDINHNFTKHGAILFVDAWGVAAFHYRAKTSEVAKLQYCENDDAQFPVIFNKRPICPRPALKSTIVEDGGITVYKPNIQSVERKAYHCFYEKIRIETSMGFFQDESNNMPLAKVIVPMDDHEQCWQWVNTKKCTLSDTIKDEKLIDHSFFNFKVPTEHFNGKMTLISNTRWATTNKVQFDYKWCGSKLYNIVNCIVDVGFIRTTPPFKTLLSPWGTIPNDYLYKAHFRRSGGEMIVWKQLQKENTCNFVPINSMDAKRITYNSKDYLEQDPHPDAKEMYHFVSDAEKSIYTSDNTQETNADKYNCIEQEVNQTLYVINNGMIISWQKGVKLNELDDIEEFANSGQRVFYPHYAFNELIENEDIGGDLSKLYSSLGGSDGSDISQTTDGNNTLSPSTCNAESQNCRQSYVIRNISNADFLAKKMSQKKSKVTLDDIVNSTKEQFEPTKEAPLFAIVAYLRYQFEQYQNEEVIRRAQAWCENQQHMYDMQLMLARMQPSVIISSYLNRPVQSQFAGNGVYNTHYCQTINNFVVVNSLFVQNNEKALRVFNDSTYNALYKKVNKDFNEQDCFTMPIVMFKDTFSVDEWRIGQVNPDNTITTLTMNYVEKCKHDSYYFHVIDENIYVFVNYKLNSVTSLNALYNHASRVETNIDHLTEVKKNRTSTQLRNQIETLLENTQFIDIYTKYEPKQVKPVVIGFKNTELFNYRQQRRMITSFEDLIAYTNDKQYAQRVYDSKLGDAKSTHTGPSLGEIGDALKDGVKFVADGITDTIDFILDTSTNTFGKIMGSAGDALGGVADFFTGGVMKIIIIIAALCVVGIILYMLVKHKLLAKDEDEKIQPHSNTYMQYQPEPYAKPMGNYSANMAMAMENQHIRNRKQETFIQEF